MTAVHDHGHHVGSGSCEARSRVHLPARLAMGMVRAYQWAFAGRVSPCRYVPSCSSYAVEALEVHGFVRGGWLSLRRLGRCHPWGQSGWDPVPERKVGK